MSQNTWLIHFKDRLTGFDELYRQSGSRLSPLGYALQGQTLSSEEYLVWATSQYGLPLLQNRFFSESSSIQKTYAQWSQHYPWSQECFPVGQWDGHLIVACLQPPENFPENSPAVFVLAGFEGLQDYWTQHLATEKSAPQIPQMAPTEFHPPAKPHKEDFSADDLDISAMPTRIQSSPDDLLEFNDNFLADSESSSSGVEIQAPEESILEGLSDNFTITHLEKTSHSVANEPTMVVESSSESSPESILEPIVVPLEISKAETVITTEESLDLLEIDPPAVVAKAPQGVVAKAPQAAPPAPVEKKSTVMTDEENLPPLPNKDTLLSSSANVVSFPKSKPNKPPTAPGQLFLEKWKKKYGAQLADISNLAFTQMQNHFEKAMLLTLDDQETQLVPFSWSENFATPTNLSAKIPLGTPSIFNIVASTQKPFHGYISINEVNEKFFEDWNQGMIPDHVTIVPVILNDQVIAMLMGLGEKSAYNRMSLQSTEKLAAEISDTLASLKVA